MFSVETHRPKLIITAVFGLNLSSENFHSYKIIRHMAQGYFIINHGFLCTGFKLFMKFDQVTFIITMCLIYNQNYCNIQSFGLEWFKGQNQTGMLFCYWRMKHSNLMCINYFSLTIIINLTEKKKWHCFSYIIENHIDHIF